MHNKSSHSESQGSSSPRYGANAMWQSLARRAEGLVASVPRESMDAVGWLAGVEERRAAFRRNLGLEPWPGPAGLPQTKEYGGISGEGYRARKLGYELAPNCWGSATIYYPDPLPPVAVPGILYTCGHSPVGSHLYHPHSVMWARRGYVCLILDTIEQNDNLGEHHGFNVHWHHLRLALGISASGLEVFNSLRALDLLAADPAVDAARLGVTGVSGGGAMSFFVAVCDERIRAVSTLCGLCSPKDALVNGHLRNHCDCMFPLGVTQMDTAGIAALIAPRAALFCFGKQDRLYHIEESCRIATEARIAWDLQGLGERWKMVVVDCPHGDHPEFDRATQEWFDQHLFGEPRPVLDRGGVELDESQICVFHGVPPTPNHLHLLPEILIPRGRVALPESPSDWPAIQAETVSALQKWIPADEPVEFFRPSTWGSEEEDVSEVMGQVEGMGLSLRMTRRSRQPRAVFLSVATGGEGGQNVMSGTAALVAHPELLACILEPRLSGWNYTGVGNPAYPAGCCFEIETRMAKAMSLLGLTPVAIFLQDIRAAVKKLRELHPGLPIHLHGAGEAAVAALLAALLDKHIAGVVLDRLPWSFADRSAVIGALRVLDIPHAVGLLAPRPVAMIDRGDGNWSWPARVCRRLGCEGALTLQPDFRSAAAALFPPVRAA